jgi:energy-coupling factor transporter ATP-binding protein EcfA2
MEGQGELTAPPPDDGADAGAVVTDDVVTDDEAAEAGDTREAPRPEAQANQAERPEDVDQPEPHVRIDARKLESALLALRHRIAFAPLLFDAPGVDDAKAERRKMLSQIDDYLLPRLRRSAAPVLVALVGSTGAGKSTLVNSIVGTQVSATGVRRPTTNSPVLACHPDDADWFAENNFLPTLPRVRQEGLARPGRDGLLVLAASEGMPKGVALLDTPDIDSVVRAHYEFAHQFLDASDLWLFMTTASRYADAPVWELLQLARDRGAALGVVLSRVPPGSRSELSEHFAAMLAANGLGAADRFVIPETVITNGMLPAEAFEPVRAWLADTAAKEDRRVAVLTQTMSGVLDTFRTRVPELAAHVETQLALCAGLREEVEGAYEAALAEVDSVTRNGALLQGELLARWQDFAATGDLLRTLQARRASAQGKKGAGAVKRPRKRRIPARVNALEASVRSGLESLIMSVADRAAEEAARRWRANPAGATLLAELAKKGGEPQGDPEFGTFGTVNGSLGTGSGPGGQQNGTADLGRSSASLSMRAARAVSAWQDHVMRLVQAENVTKRSIARVASFDEESLTLVLVIGLLEGTTGEAAHPDPVLTDPASVVPQRLLTSLFGAGPLRDIGAKARTDLHERISLLFDEEMLRFAAAIDAEGAPDDTAATELYQATYSLEGAR